MKTMIKTILLTLSMLTSIVKSFDGWEPVDLNQDVDEKTTSYSEDGMRAALGYKMSIDGDLHGIVQVYDNVDGSWVPYRDPIIQQDVINPSKYVISLSSDGDKIAIGSTPSAGSLEQGRARVFEDQGNSWEQIGGDITGNPPDHNIGYSLALSQDGTLVAVGAHDSNGDYVRTYMFENDDWSFKESIEGTEADEWLRLWEMAKAFGLPMTI